MGKKKSQTQQPEKAAPAAAASPSPAAPAGGNKNAPVSSPKQSASARKRMPIVEDLVIPPHKPERRRFFGGLKYKLYAELAMGTLEPWERAITNAVILAILAISFYQMYLWGAMAKTFVVAIVDGKEIADAAAAAGFI